MMTRVEFNAFWLPILNDMAQKRRQPWFAEADLDGMWHNYLIREDGGLQERADAVVAGEKVN
jgi:hypothetical protein